MATLSSESCDLLTLSRMELPYTPLSSLGDHNYISIFKSDALVIVAKCIKHYIEIDLEAEQRRRLNLPRQAAREKEASSKAGSK